MSAFQLCKIFLFYIIKILTMERNLEMRLLTGLGLSLLLAGCTAGSGHYTQSVQSWRGGYVNELQKVWGKPYEMMKGQNGNTTYIYKRQSFVATNQTYSPGIGIARNDGTVVTSTPNINAPWNRGYAAYCLTSFTATAAGKIVDTNIQGTSCYISDETAQKLANPGKNG
jgi:hypothetical protein